MDFKNAYSNIKKHKILTFGSILLLFFGFSFLFDMFEGRNTVTTFVIYGFLCIFNFVVGVRSLIGIIRGELD